MNPCVLAGPIDQSQHQILDHPMPYVKDLVFSFPISLTCATGSDLRS